MQRPLQKKKKCRWPHLCLSQEVDKAGYKDISHLGQRTLLEETEAEWYHKDGEKMKKQVVRSVAVELKSCVLSFFSHFW